MIVSKAELKECLKIERKLYFKNTRYNNIINYLTNDPRLKVWKYIKILRKTEYYYNNMKKSLIYKLLYFLYRRRKNRWGIKLGIDIWENSFETGLIIHHPGNIVINGHARIGKNCSLHGNNCIGNNGFTTETPVIGNNVDIGFGASIIGNVTIADNVKIGAGAVVVKSCNKEGATLVGIPAREV